jgi:hypothetical protein
MSDMPPPSGEPSGAELGDPTAASAPWWKRGGSMPILLAIALILLILVLIASALWDRDGDDAGDDNGATTSQGAPDTDPPGTDGATTVAPDTTSPDTTSPTTTSPDTTSPATTSPATTSAPTTPATTAPSGGSGNSGGGDDQDDKGDDKGDDKADGRVVVIEGSTGQCRFGDNCLIAGFRAIGFTSGEKEYVCEFADGSRYTYKFGASTVEYACATGARPDSITIEVDGVRSATIRTGDPGLTTK